MIRPSSRTLASAGIALATTLGIIAALVVAGLMTGRLAALHVTSGSMSPAIAEGDLIVASLVPAEAIEVGDVVTVTSDGDLLTHRVDEILPAAGEARELVLKGDANLSQDAQSYTVEEVLRTTWIIGSGGRAIQAMSTPPAPYLFLGAALCLAVLATTQARRSRPVARSAEDGPAHGALVEEIPATEPQPQPADEPAIDQMGEQGPEADADPEEAAVLEPNSRDDELVLKRTAEELVQTPGISDALRDVEEADSSHDANEHEDVLAAARDVEEPEWALVGAAAKADGRGAPSHKPSGRRAAAVEPDLKPTGRRRAAGEPLTAPAGRKGRHAAR